MAKRDCPLCGETMEDPPAIHDIVKCEKTELLKGRIEIKRLKQSLVDWKDGWFYMRELLGNLYWNHPAIDDDKEREYYRSKLIKTNTK